MPVYPKSGELDAAHDYAAVQIDYPHFEVHEGHFYTVTRSDTIDAGVANRLVVRFTTPNTAARFHMAIEFTSSNSGVLLFNENPTVNAAGTAITIYNNDRNSANATTLTAFYDTTLTADGTNLATIVVGSNGPGVKLGGTARSKAEWILKQAEDYVVVFTADNNGTVVSVVAEYYEN